MAVSFDEQWGSPTASFVDGKLTGQRIFLIDWNDQIAFIGELFGTYKNVGGSFVYDAPKPFPNVPDLIPVSIRAKPFGEKITTASTTLLGDANMYEKAHVTVDYAVQRVASGGAERTDLPTVPEGTYLTYSADIGAEYMTIPGKNWKWASGTGDLGGDTPVGVLLPSETFTLTWERVPAPPWSTIRDTVGNINDDTFLGYDAGTVLFMGARPSISFQIAEENFWSLAYTFKTQHKQSMAGNSIYGWNRFWKTDPVSSEHWIEMVDSKNGTKKPYETADLDALFQFA